MIIYKFNTMQIWIILTIYFVVDFFGEKRYHPGKLSRYIKYGG